MRITQNLKNRLAQRPNITHIASVCSTCHSTWYYHFVSVKTILSTPNGKSLSRGRYNGMTYHRFYTDNPNAVVIRYSDLF